jgi:peptidoglycan/LPS O-acetylase OafA/YrhL
VASTADGNRLAEPGKMGSAAPAYRPEIDGLRALAVIPVVLYHAGIKMMPGGFLGVDVFFVISGYLISRLLLLELDRGRFSILNFYARRARRILPLLFLVIAVTFPVSWWLMPPDSFAVYLGSFRAAALSYSNIFFWQSSGYFSPAAEDQPLLHTWSLSVEEQFYLIFPVLLLGLHRFAERRLFFIFSSIMAIGFLVCVAQVWIDRDVAFFMLHARAWELSAGVVCALIERERLRLPLPQQWLPAIGVAAIVIGFMVVSDQDRVPGVWTLLPVLGTSLVILAASSSTRVGRALALRPLVAIGLISYGAYLWHYPLFAFARLYLIDRPSPFLFLALAILSFMLAAVSYRLVETPFRRSKQFHGWSLAASATACALLFAGVATVGLKKGWDVARFDPAMLASVTPPHSKGEDCVWRYPVESQRDIAFCPLGREGVAHPVVLWGDSHAQALIDELDLALDDAGLSGIYVASSSCLRLPGIYVETGGMDRKAAKCEALQEQIYAALLAIEPRQLIVSLRWTFRMYPLSGAGPTIGFDNGEGGAEAEDHRIYVAKSAEGNWSESLPAKTDAVARFLARLAKIAPLTVVGPIPEVGWNIANRNFKTVVLRGQGMPDVTTSHEVFIKRNAMAMQILAKAQASSGFDLLDAAALFCGTDVKGRCLAQWQGRSYYADDDHVSAVGARLIVDRLKSSWAKAAVAQP